MLGYEQEGLGENEKPRTRVPVSVHARVCFLGSSWIRVARERSIRQWRRRRRPSRTVWCDCKLELALVTTSLHWPHVYYQHFSTSLHAHYEWPSWLQQLPKLSVPSKVHDSPEPQCKCTFDVYINLLTLF